MTARVPLAAVSRHLEWVDTDAAGHHHNSVIMRCVEACEAQLFRELELPDYFGQAPRVRQEVSFRAKLYFGQETTTELFLDRLGESSMTFSFQVWGEAFRDTDRRLAADGLFVTVFVPFGTEASAPWPESIRERVQAHAVRDDGSADPHGAGRPHAVRDDDSADPQSAGRPRAAQDDDSADPHSA